MNNKRKLLEVRNTQWQALCDKYEKRGKIHTDDCAFDEVNYKLFAKSQLLRSRGKKKKANKKNAASHLNKSSCNNTEGKTENTLDVDISDIIDDDVYEVLPKEQSDANSGKVLSVRTLKESNTMFSPTKDKRNKENGHSFTTGKYDSVFENWPSAETDKNGNSKHTLNKDNSIATTREETKAISHVKKHPLNKENRDTETPDALQDLVHFVEIDLRSPLKEMTTSRSESKILETDDYTYWHDRTKGEMKRLRKYISREELKEYMRYCNKDVNLSLVRGQNGAKNKLKELLIKREFARDNEERYLKYCNRIYDEWRKLIVDVPVEHIILYASCVMNSVKEGKHAYSLSYRYQSQKGNTMESQKESIDSGFVTI